MLLRKLKPHRFKEWDVQHLLEDFEGKGTIQNKAIMIR